MIEPIVLVMTISAVLWILCGITAAASSRNRSAPGWFLLGCVLGVFALVLVLALPAGSLSNEPPAPPMQLGRGDW